MKTYIIISFYKFVPLYDLDSLRMLLLDEMKAHRILGTLILAEEGINGGFAGLSEDVASFCSAVRRNPNFSDIEFKAMEDDLMPFEKAKVKIRREIVTLGVPGVDATLAGEYVAPEAWNDFISDPNVLLIDTRNDYEVELGTFVGAINPDTENFRDFPAYVEKHLLDKKDKKIAMCCTGGIRCEKSTAYLKQLGFKEVYHLEGGILNYLKVIPKERSLWQGKCFVFDERIAV